MRFLYIALATTLIFCSDLNADIVTVSVTGSVSFNGINDPPLSGVNSGDAVEMSFTVDSDFFMDGVPGDTRGYEINQSSFSMSFNTTLAGSLEVGLLNPFPGTPYFTLVDGFPVSDGFFVSTSPISPGGVPLEQEPFNANLELGYSGDTLSSLDILDAIGVYNFDGLTSFGFTLWVGSPDNVAMEIEFQQMTISRQVPEPTAFAILAPLGLLMFGRRHR
jgi:hypothetical protein